MQITDCRSLIGIVVPSTVPIEEALFEHYGPYGEALAEEAAPGEPLPSIATSNQVWPHVSLVFVSVTLMDGGLTTELGYTTAWDEGHTLGARFESGNCH